MSAKQNYPLIHPPEGVFGPSGTLANQIVLGAPADIALFSNAQHATWLKVARLVPAGSEPVLFGYTPMVIGNVYYYLVN